MNIVKSIEQLRDEIRSAKRHGTVVSLVPTMGYLHRGHKSLVTLAKQKSDHVIVSLFVNPAQFNDAADFELYPRDFERDRQVLHEAGVDTVFAPDVDVMYGDHFQTSIRLSSLAASFEGRSRPGHFEGMATVVSILFNLVEPDLAIFGEKDFQQLRIIEQMVDDLKFHVRLVRAPLMRDSDGLALSSRNVRLSREGRTKALSLSRGLFLASEAYREGEVRPSVLSQLARAEIVKSGMTLDYAEVVLESTLETPPHADDTCRILAAALIDEVRLIDNIPLRKF